MSASEEQDSKQAEVIASLNDGWAPCGWSFLTGSLHAITEATRERLLPRSHGRPLEDHKYGLHPPN